MEKGCWSFKPRSLGVFGINNKHILVEKDAEMANKTQVLVSLKSKFLPNKNIL